MQPEQIRKFGFGGNPCVFIELFQSVINGTRSDRELFGQLFVAIIFHHSGNNHHIERIALGKTTMDRPNGVDAICNAGGTTVILGFKVILSGFVILLDYRKKSRTAAAV